uniref:SOS response-associated peptidase family protein n=1 Tax=Mycobacterium tuberculosis TaxID=1773 RepID=UPI0019015E65
LVTRGALGGAAEIHDRMPLVLPRELHDEWLDPERAGDAELVRKAVSVSEEISRALLGIGPDAAEGTGGSGGSAGSGGSRGSGGSQAAEHPRLF